jgi:hypothetical protein
MADALLIKTLVVIFASVSAISLVARKTSGGRRLPIGWFGYRAARLTTHRLKR